MYLKGSKPFYIGGAADFLEYCHSYYDIDVYLAPEKIEGLTANFTQFRNHIENEKRSIKRLKDRAVVVETPVQTDFVICISGAGHPLTMHLISGLLDMSAGEKRISKIYIYDSDCPKEFLELVERECVYVGTDHAAKVVKYIDKIGTALTHADLLIILDHAPFE